MRFPWTKKVETKGYQDVLQRLIMSQQGNLNSMVTPDNCMKSPTVNAVVTAVSRRISATPVHVLQKNMVDGKTTKKEIPDHPISRLLKRPNSWQSDVDFWQDAASVYVRWGRFYAYKSGGSSRMIAELLPYNPGHITVQQDDSTWRVSYKVNTKKSAEPQEIPANKMFVARGPARDFVTGDSPVEDVKTAIALEIMAEQFGANFFHNGALPLLIFAFSEGSAGFETVEQEKQFLEDVKQALGGSNQLSSMLVPKGMEKPSTVSMDHDKAQFLETRKYQRTVIAGAFGVPPHLVGDLERGTFNNVEQQSQDFTENVILPVVRAFESAMERDLLTEQERDSGIIIRFNLDGKLRASFKDRQEGLRIQREMGIINANEWREREGMNPRDDDEGDEYLHPSNMMVDGEQPDEPQPDDSPGDQESQEQGV